MNHVVELSALERLSTLEVTLRAPMMVTVTVDSSPVNATFAVVIDAIKQLSAAFAGAQSAHERSMAAVKKQLSDDLATARGATDAAIKDAKTEASREADALRQEIARLKEALSQMQQRSATHALEAQLAELQAQIRLLREAGDVTAAVAKSSKEKAIAAAEDVDLLSRLFEIPRATAISAVCRQDAVSCVLSLPFSKELLRAVNERITGDRDGLSDGLEAMRKALLLKANETSLQGLSMNLAALEKRVTRAEADVSDATCALTKKAAKSEMDDGDQLLHRCKADRSELIDFLKREALDKLRAQVGDLSARLDSVFAQLQLELAGLTPAAGKAASAVMERRRSSTSDLLDPKLFQRLAAVEAGVIDLSARKADKSELAALLQHWTEEHARAISAAPRPVASVAPPMAPSPAPTTERTTPSKSLAPIQRPLSAKLTSETSRPPSPSLAYTSMSVARSNSPVVTVNRTATAQLFDSDGCRTMATVAQVKAVSAVEHWNNMAAAAARPSTQLVPPSHVEHVMIVSS